MTSKRVSEQSFHIPLEYADPDSNPRSAGDLSVTIKYKSSVGMISSLGNSVLMEKSQSIYYINSVAVLLKLGFCN